MVVVTHGKSPLDLSDYGFASEEEEVTRVGNLQKVLMIHDINLYRGLCKSLTFQNFELKVCREFASLKLLLACQLA
jgi:hypothetical protein